MARTHLGSIVCETRVNMLDTGKKVNFNLCCVALQEGLVIPSWPAKGFCFEQAARPSSAAGLPTQCNLFWCRFMKFKRRNKPRG